MSPAKRPPCGDANHMRKTAELPPRSMAAARRLDKFREIFRILLQDDNFINLLRAESMSTVPVYLSSLGGKGDRS